MPFLSAHWEKLLLAIVVLLLGGFFVSQRLLQRQVATPPPALAPMPAPPTLVPWQAFRLPVQLAEVPKDTDNPFRKSFTFPAPPKPKPAPVPAKKAEAPKPPAPPPPPPPPPPHLLTIDFDGYLRFDGLPWALLKLKDSKTGESQRRATIHESIADGYRIQEIDADQITLRTPDGKTIAIRRAAPVTITLPNDGK